MQKIPTLFVMDYPRPHEKMITRMVRPGFEWVANGEGIATVKIDGSACAVIDGRFYRRYDAKAGKQPPPDAIPCSDPDPTTGHWPHWVPVDEGDKGGVWHLAAYRNSGGASLPDGTYEAVGPHFQTNRYKLGTDILERHGIRQIPDAPRNFDELREFLRTHNIEGIVFWKDGVPRCKIRRKDFGFRWPAPDAPTPSIETDNPFPPVPEGAGRPAEITIG